MQQHRCDYCEARLTVSGHCRENCAGERRLARREMREEAQEASKWASEHAIAVRPERRQMVRSARAGHGRRLADALRNL